MTQNSLGSGAATGKQIFPIGYSASSTDYTPCTINNTGTTNDISVYLGSGRLANGTSGTAKTEHCIDRSWYVSSSGAGYSVAMTLQWDVARELTSFTRTNCHIGHYNGSSWDSSPGESSATNVSGTIYSVSRSTITSFSPFDVEDPSALPIKLIYFKAIKEANNVRLNWETATEENNDYFTIERSKDGKTFEKLFTKEGAGTSKTSLFYVGFDSHPFNGISYYRLKQTDTDGKFAYSEIQSVEFNSTMDDNDKQIQVSVYPNPATDNTFHIDLTTENEETIFIKIYDEVGKLIFHEDIASEKGKNILTINLPGVTSGVYLLEVNSETIGIEEHQVKF